MLLCMAKPIRVSGRCNNLKKALRTEDHFYYVTFYSSIYSHLRAPHSLHAS